MEKDNKLKSKIMETYTEDMVKAIENEEGGLIKKIIHEEEEHEAEKINLSPKSKKNRTFMFVSITLLVSALVILIFLVIFKKKASIVPVVPQFTSLIFTDQTDFTPVDGLTKDKITETVLNQISNTKVKSGGIDGIYLTENKKVIGFSRLVSFLEGNLNQSQLGFINDNFLLGTLNDGSKDFFALLKISSFADIFPVMRAWENKMLYDLHGFLGVNISSDTNYLFTKNFEDGIVANKNARILKNKDGRIVLMYVFVNDSSVIITNSESATNEVILRLTSSQIKK
jgi:hypothetical protein